MAKTYTHILLDIEGTTTPISFVHEVLLEKFLEQNWTSDSLQYPYIDDIRKQSLQDEEQGLEGIVYIPREQSMVTPHTVAENVRSQMRMDRKIGPLKALQGYMWKEGYASGELKGEVYPDVPRAFERWKSEGKRIYIYSSGSIAAQKLLFGNSTSGNLLASICGHFDTTKGAKTDARSYNRIADDMGLKDGREDQVMFLSDNVVEVAAARRAGLQALMVWRPGNAPVRLEDEATFGKVIESFDVI